MDSCRQHRAGPLHQATNIDTNPSHGTSRVAEASAMTASHGNFPVAASPLSITASAPSQTAFCRSDTSARVGMGCLRGWIAGTCWDLLEVLWRYGDYGEIPRKWEENQEESEEIPNFCWANFAKIAFRRHLVCWYKVLSVGNGNAGKILNHALHHLCGIDHLKSKPSSDLTDETF